MPQTPLSKSYRYHDQCDYTAMYILVWSGDHHKYISDQVYNDLMLVTIVLLLKTNPAMQVYIAV